MNVVEALCNNLCQAGMDATVNPEKKGLLSQLSPFGAKSIGKIKLRGRQIEELELFGHYAKSNQKRFGAGARSSLEAVDIDYILYGNFKGKKKLLEARLNVKRTGLVHKKVVEMRWEGGALAEKLNSDSTVHELLWQSVGQLAARDIEVKLNEDTGSVMVHVRDDRWILAAKLPPFQMYEKMAKHISDLAGASSSVSSPSSQETVAAEPVPEPSENSYALADTVTIAPPPAAPKQPEPPTIIPILKAVSPPVSVSIQTDIPTVISPKPDGPLCSKCGYRNLAGAQICTNCGFLIETTNHVDAEGIVCKKCGGMNPAGAKLCRKCGSKFEAILTTSPLKQSGLPSSIPVSKQPEMPTAIPPQEGGFLCANCGYQNKTDAKFCAKCGEKVETSRSRFCPKCGAPVAEDEKFCDKCGTKMSRIGKS